MRVLKVTVLLLLCGHVLLYAQPARRKALIIGNSAYVNAAVFPNLKGGPINDANAIERALITAGVAQEDITVLYDQNYQDFVTALSRFRASLTENDAALFYFSGHGFSMDGEDYLVPIDFSSFQTKDETRRLNISLHQVLDNLSKAPSRVLVLDACRTTAPLLKAAVNDADKASVEPLVLLQGTGSLVAYSSSSGRPSMADSPGDGLSFFTFYLVRVLNLHPQTMLDALNRAKDNTSSASQNQQVPAVYNEMAYDKVTQNFSFTAKGPRTESDYWTDPATGLMWTARDSGSNVGFRQAESYCQKLNLGGYSGWQLPEFDELQGIYDPSTSDGHVKGNLVLNGWEWSKTRNASETRWSEDLGFDFRDGSRKSSQIDAPGYVPFGAKALCVRHP